MRVIHKMTVHLDDRRYLPGLDAVQLDADTRVLELTLMAGGVAWEVPSGMGVSVAFRKSDGRGGWYDKLPDGSKACSVSGNVVTAVLAPEVLTCAGKTEVAVIVQDPSTLDQIAAFPVTVMVARNPAAGQGLSNDYFKYKTLTEVNDAVVGFGKELESFSESLRPEKFTLTAANVANEGWKSVRDLPAGRVYRFPYGNHPEGFGGLPYVGAKQSTLVVIGAGDAAWYRLYLCAVKNGNIYMAYDDAAATGPVQWKALKNGEVLVEQTGSAEAPLDLSGYGIGTGSVVRFLPGKTYTVAPFHLKDAAQVRFCLEGATVVCAGDRFLKAEGCDGLKISGGTVTGGKAEGGSFYGVELHSCPGVIVEQVTFRGVGDSSMQTAAGIHMLGDCTGFSVDRCVFEDITAGQVGSDGFIHAYGLFVNRLGSTNAYSRTGTVSGCLFRNVAGKDNGVKADGDGIFIQRNPWWEGDVLMGVDQKIVIGGCSFIDCKKRGVKSAAYGTEIRDCRFEGEFWLGAVEFQFGHGSVSGCHIVNTSHYNGSVTCGIAVGDGGVTVEDTYISCPYENTYHPGIRLKSRHGSGVLVGDWDPCVFRRCHLDGVNYGICSFQEEADARLWHLSEFRVEDCRIGRINRDRAVYFDGDLIGSIGAVKVTDLKLDGPEALPVEVRARVTDSFHVYSRHQVGACVGGAVPEVRDLKVVSCFGPEEPVRYVERRSWGSRACGVGAPGEALEALLGGCLGDEYTDLGTGDKYVRTGDGWTKWR